MRNAQTGKFCRCAGRLPTASAHWRLAPQACEPAGTAAAPPLGNPDAAPRATLQGLCPVHHPRRPAVRHDRLQPGHAPDLHWCALLPAATCWHAPRPAGTMQQHARPLTSVLAPPVARRHRPHLQRQDPDVRRQRLAHVLWRRLPQHHHLPLPDPGAQPAALAALRRAHLPAHPLLDVRPRAVRVLLHRERDHLRALPGRCAAAASGPACLSSASATPTAPLTQLAAPSKLLHETQPGALAAGAGTTSPEYFIPHRPTNLTSETLIPQGGQLILRSNATQMWCRCGPAQAQAHEQQLHHHRGKQRVAIT